MTTTFLMVRHAAHDNVGGWLAGRTAGVRLGPDGRAQAERLAERMRRERFEAIHVSPRERTQETAAAIAAACGTRAVATCPDLDEIDFGEWSGKDFDELNRDPRWRRWNEARGEARTPAGETMADVRQRLLNCIDRVAADHPEAAVVLVSHADVIKTAVCHVLGLPAEAGSRFDVDPASITTIVVGDWGSKLLGLNEVVV